jgi:hypothetical protein
MNLRYDMQYILGKPIYSFTLYEKVKRVTIPLYDNDYQILMMSFDLEGSHEFNVLEKVLTLLQRIQI